VELLILMLVLLELLETMQVLEAVEEVVQPALLVLVFMGWGYTVVWVARVVLDMDFLGDLLDNQALYKFGSF
jgi:hypothetical protein